MITDDLAQAIGFLYQSTQVVEVVLGDVVVGCGEAVWGYGYVCDKDQSAAGAWANGGGGD